MQKSREALRDVAGDHGIRPSLGINDLLDTDLEVLLCNTLHSGSQVFTFKQLHHDVSVCLDVFIKVGNTAGHPDALSNLLVQLIARFLVVLEDYRHCESQCIDSVYVVSIVVGALGWVCTLLVL